MIASPSIRGLRLLHSFIRRYNRVGPPDPVSNLRPTIYDDLEPESSAPHTSPRTTIHPYSLFEFKGPDASSNSELHWRLHRQQLDAFDQAFWSNVGPCQRQCTVYQLSSLEQLSI
jgi:apoptogenic protein 1